MVCSAKPVLAKAIIINNMLYVQYVHIDEMPSKFIRDKPICSSERMLHKDYDRKSSVEKERLWS
jgi:hypothetical protein